MEAAVSRYGDRIPDIEVWNEINLLREFTPERCLEILKTANTAAKRANPNVRVLFSGTAGVALDFLGRIYELDGAPFFDAVNVRPYCQPRAPEGYVPGD